MDQPFIKIAVFDVDGTIYNGNLGIELIKKLVNDKIFLNEIGKKIFEWYEKYKNGEVEKFIAIDNCYKYTNQGLKDLSVELIHQKAKEVWEIIKIKIFPFTKPLIKILKDNGFEIVLLSGSPFEMISLLGQELNISQNNLISGISGIKDNFYTGIPISYIGSSNQKVDEIKKYINNHKIKVNWKESFAFGDNERDIGIFELVGNPIAVNPDSYLEKYAKTKGIEIVNQNTILNICIKKLS